MQKAQKLNFQCTYAESAHNLFFIADALKMLWSHRCAFDPKSPTYKLCSDRALLHK